MSYRVEDVDFETILAGERARLVRLCARLSGSSTAAEDLVQETLLAAWRSRAQLTSLEKVKPWTPAIARHVCLNWARRHYRESAQMALEFDEEPLEDEIPAELDLELELDRDELAHLLDQALALLPPDTARLLIAYYLEEASHAEIAQRLKIQPGLVAMRLHRGKLTLQRLLHTELRAASTDLGLVSENEARWETTNIWCPTCGQARLSGYFEKDKMFALRCPHCEVKPQAIMAGLDLTKSYHARLLGNVKAYKPAYARLITAFLPVYRQALQDHAALCIACGQPLQIRITHDSKEQLTPFESSQILLYCPSCGWASNKSLVSLVLALPEAQKFWRTYPRLRTLPPLQSEQEGIAVIVTRLQSLTNAAEFSAVSRRDTLGLISFHTPLA